MNLKILCKPNYYNESATLLIQLVNGLTPESKLNDLKTKAFYSQREAYILSDVELLKKLHDALKAVIDLSDERIQLLFKTYPEREGELPIALVDIFVDYHCPELTPRCNDSRFAAIVGFTDDPLTHPEVCDEKSLHEYVFLLNTDENLKYSLIYCFYRFDSLQSYVLDLLRLAATTISPILSDVDGMLSEYNAAIADIEADFNGYFKKNFNFALDEGSNCYIYPYLSGFSSLKIMSDWNSEDVYIFIGCHYIGNKASGGLTPENLAVLLKALSDETKLKIIQMLKVGPMYNAQIAERLSLTPATISHHTSALSSMELLSIEKVNNRVYFSLRTETLSKTLEALRTMLL